MRRWHSLRIPACETPRGGRPEKSAGVPAGSDVEPCGEPAGADPALDQPRGPLLHRRRFPGGGGLALGCAEGLFRAAEFAAQVLIRTVGVLGRCMGVSDLVGDARHLSPSAQEALRLRAVAALVEGRDREEVAAVFRVSLKAVDGWWVKWRAGGREALTARPRGKRVGEHQVLSEAEQAALRQAVLDHRLVTWGFRGSCGLVTRSVC
ncbi:helix-turn-helix domain-containing protein [Streptomyces avermitilis]